MEDSRSRIIKDVLLGFTITTFLVGASILAKHTPWGHSVELLAFEKLQGQLSPFNPEEELPIVVVDISNIREGQNNSVVDFEKLKEVVSAIADEKPRVIGIDVELPPNSINLENADAASIEKFRRQIVQYVEFLDFCLRLKESGVPVFLGIDGRKSRESAEWLGEEKYKNLAATFLKITNDTTRIPIWFKTKPESEKLFSLSFSLAKSYKLIHQPAVLSWAIEDEEDFSGNKIYLEGDAEYLSALVNYSKLEVIRQNKLLTVSKKSVEESGEKFRNKMVILGDDTKATDRFVIAGRDKAIPGVYLHASAAYTFAREPMYEFKFCVRLLLDFLLSALIIVWVAIKRCQNLRKNTTFDWHKLQFWLGSISLILIALVAWLLVLFVGVLWLDFLFVAFFLWIHPTFFLWIQPTFERIIASKFSKK